MILKGENNSAKELLRAHLERANHFHWDVSTSVQAHEDSDPRLRQSERCRYWNPLPGPAKDFKWRGQRWVHRTTGNKFFHWGWLSDRNDLHSFFLRLSSHTWTCLGEHVRLHSYLHPYGWVPGAERRPRGGSVLQGPSAHQFGCGDTRPLFTWNYQLHGGAGWGSTQHIRGEMLLAWAAMQSKLLNPAARSLFCSCFELLIIFFKPILCIINTLFTLMCLVIVLGQCKSHKLSWDVWILPGWPVPFYVLLKFNVMYVWNVEEF